MIQQFQDYLILESDKLKVIYTFKNQIFKTALIENKYTNEVLQFEDSNEFEIVFKNGLIVNKHHLTLEKYGVTKSKVRFYFKEFKGIQINYVAQIDEKKHYFYSNLEINIQDNLIEEYIVDRIDFVSLNVMKDCVYHNPIQFEELGEEEFYLHLGQPVYLDSFFVANEFPITQNMFQSSKLVFRKYLGKTLSKQYISENNVFGVSKTSVQTAFYEYLEDIKIKSIPYFNYQVTVENNYEEILEKFNNLNQQLNQQELPILQYLTLKNWYNPKSKFEEESEEKLRFLSENLVKNGGHLGLYFSLVDGLDQDYLEQNQLGSINLSMINISDYRYLDLLKHQVIHYLENYPVSYLEFDIQFSNPLQYSGEYYIGGGYKNLYSYHDTYERYIELFQELRKVKKGLKISVSVSSLSPFFLKYVNALQEVDAENSLQIPLQYIYKNEKLDLSRSQLYYLMSKGRVLHFINEINNDVIEVLRWYLNHQIILSNAIEISENGIRGYYVKDKIIALKNKSDQIQNFNSDFIKNEQWVNVISGQYINEIQLNPNEIVILENRSYFPLKIEKIKLLASRGKIYLNQSLIGKPNIYFNNEKVDYMFNPILNQIDFNFEICKEINEIVINDLSGTKIEYKKYYPHSIMLKQEKNYEFEMGLSNRVDFSLSLDIEVDTFNRTLLKQKNNFEVKINSEGKIEFIIKEIKVTLNDFKAVIPQKFKLRIDKRFNDCIVFYVDGYLKQVISLPNLHKVAFTNEKLLLADIVSNFELKEI